jgi:SOS-response transcriptional repressor LexA
MHMAPEKLTRRQRQILDFVDRQHRQTGVAPSTYEIQEHFGFASQTAAVNHLRALERNAIRLLERMGFPEDVVGKAMEYSNQG